MDTHVYRDTDTYRTKNMISEDAMKAGSLSNESTNDILRQRGSVKVHT